MSLPVWKSFQVRRFVSWCTRHGNVQRNALTQSLGLQNGVWYAESSQIADLSRLQSTNRNGKLQCKTMQNCWILVFVGLGPVGGISFAVTHPDVAWGHGVVLAASFHAVHRILRPLGLKLKEPPFEVGKGFTNHRNWLSFRVPLFWDMGWHLKMKYSRINTDSWIGSVWIHLICLGWRKLGLKQFTQLFTKFTHIVPL